MATLSEAVRRLTIETTTRGVKEAAADLKAVAAGQEAVAVTGQKAERAQQSVESAFARTQRRYDSTIRAQQEFLRIMKVAAAAEAQNVGTQRERLDLLQRVADVMERRAAASGQYAMALNAETAAAKSARDSAAVFAAELDRMEEIARQKAAQAGAAFSEELNSRLVAGAGKSARDAAAVFAAELDRVDEIARLKAEQAGAAFQSSLNASFGIGANRSGSSARASAAVFEDAARQAAEMERLRAKFNPLFAASKQYEAELDDLNRAHKLAAINAYEYGIALTSLNDRYKQAAVSGAVYGAESGMALQQTRNLAFQFQDIGTMLASGQSPFILLAQQLPQVTMYGGQLTGVMAALRSSVAGIFSPLGLLTVAFTVAASAAISYFMRSADSAKRLDDALAGHRQALDQLAKAYGVAADAADDYARRSVTRLEAVERQTRRTLEAAAQAQFGDMFKGLGAGFFDPEILRSSNVTSVFEPFRGAIEDLRRSIRDGRPDFETFDRSIEEAVKASRNPGQLRLFADRLLEMTNSAADAARALGMTEDALRNVSHINPDTVRAQQSIIAIGDIAEKTTLRLRDLYVTGSTLTNMLAGLDALGRGVSPKGDAIGGKGSMDRAGEQFDYLYAQALRMGDLWKDLGQTFKTTKEKAQKADPWRDLVKGAMDQIEALRSVAKTFGMTGVEADAYRFKLELLQKATDKGRAVDEAKRRKIEELAAAYRIAATAAAVLKEFDELQFERAQMFRSETEQRVYAQLRQTGLDINSVEGERVATAIRQNEALKKQKELFEAIGNTLADLFTQPLKDADEFFKRILSGFAEIGQANIKGFFDGLLSSRGGAAANDNDPWAGGYREIGKAVEQGAAKGSSLGTATGLFQVFSAMGMSDRSAGFAATGLSAGLGGFGIGYQTQSPLMGAVGGAIGGWAAGSSIAALGAAGGPVGAVIGLVVGLIGGIIGAAEQRRKELEQALGELNENRGKMETLIAQGLGKGVGEITKAIRDYYDASRQFQELAHKAGEEDSVARMQAATSKFFETAYTDFVRAFDGMNEAMRSGLGADSPFVKGKTSVENLREELKGFVEDARFVSEEWVRFGGILSDAEIEARVDAARRSAQAMALALLTGTRQMTAMQAETQRLDGVAAALMTTLQDLGLSAKDAGQMIDQALATALNRLATQYLVDVNRSINELSGAGFLNELMDAQTAYQTRLNDLAALGLDSSLAMQELSLRIRQVATDAGLTQEQLARLAQVFPDMASALLGALGAGGGTDQAVADAKAAAEQAKADLRSAYEAEIATLRQTVSAHEQYVRSLEAFRDSLKLDGNLSPYDPQQRFAMAQQDFQQVTQAAMAGDADAIGKVEDVSRQYLEEARAYYGTSEGYFQIFEEVQRILDGVLATARTGLTDAQQQIAILEAQRDAQLGTIDATLSVADAVQNLAAANAAYAQAQAQRDAMMDSRFDAIAALVRQTQATQYTPEITRLYQSVLGRAPDAAGAAFWQAGIDRGMGMDTIYRQFIQSVINAGVTPNADVARAYGFPGFAAGGLHYGGLRMVGERGPEIEATGPSRIWNADQTRAFLGNDNSAVVAALREEIGALRAELSALRRENTEVTLNAGRANVEATARVDGAIREQTNEVRKATGRRAA